MTESREIHSSVTVPPGVELGQRVAMAEEVLIRGRLRIGDDVLVGPRAVFAPGEGVTVVEDAVHIEAAAVIGAGVRLGRGARVRAGAVVLADVPPNALVAGNPARVEGYVSELPTPGVVAAAPEAGAGPTDLGVGGAKLYRLHKATDTRGSLTVAEVGAQLPFEPKRFFVVHDVPSSELRGEHAHRECHQFLVCVRGSCRVLVDDGQARAEALLDRPELGVYMPPMIWGTQYRYSADAALLVLASHPYEPADYIREYEEFLCLKEPQ